MKRGPSVEQGLTPLADGIAAKSTLTLGKRGIAVADSEALIRRITR